MFYHLNCFKIQKASFNKRNKRQARSCVLLSRMNSKILGSSIRLINRPSPHLLPTVTEQRQKLQSIARCKNNHHKSSCLSSENNSSPVDNNANIHQKKKISAPAKITLARAPSTNDQQLKKHPYRNPVRVFLPDSRSFSPPLLQRKRNRKLGFRNNTESGMVIKKKKKKNTEIMLLLETALSHNFYQKFCKHKIIR